MVRSSFVFRGIFTVVVLFVNFYTLSNALLTKFSSMPSDMKVKTLLMLVNDLDKANKKEYELNMRKWLLVLNSMKLDGREAEAAAIAKAQLYERLGQLDQAMEALEEAPLWIDDDLSYRILLQKCYLASKSGKSEAEVKKYIYDLLNTYAPLEYKKEAVLLLSQFEPEKALELAQRYGFSPEVEEDLKRKISKIMEERGYLDKAAELVEDFEPDRAYRLYMTAGAFEKAEKLLARIDRGAKSYAYKYAMYRLKLQKGFLRKRKLYRKTEVNPFIAKYSGKYAFVYDYTKYNQVLNEVESLGMQAYEKGLNYWADKFFLLKAQTLVEIYPSRLQAIYFIEKTFSSLGSNAKRRLPLLNSYYKELTH